ncbi:MULTISPECIES: glycosyltransferase family 4 protein [unclassified Corallococcus]|uniref:glycosyltransferase family 4 protein n=1 Tax=unclassified Corallococcus TaxID=2685029 RepID=UPI001A8C4876|nr:glycosyltransferase family 4 protein [Corallococcus sp. NCRR]MBN9688226.1 glycosyltransferase family 4 protein [Corallococcus sp. NCSPR001]WAS87969.1 glycosyltransferase family 4 protein [Corallococcus sp. NCRR]
MRILFLNPVGILGGAERALVDLLACLRAQDPGLSLHLIAGTDGPLVETARGLGVEARVLALPDRLSALGDSGLREQGHAGLLRFARELAPTPLLLTRYGLDLRRAVRDAAPDLLHSNGIKTHLLSAATTGLPIPRVWHVHDFLGERPLVRRALSGLHPLASAAIANSQAVGDDARTVLGKVPVHVVPNGVDVERFSPAAGDGAHLDALAGLPPAPPGTLRVGLVATYARWKGHDVFLEAAALLTRQAPALPVRFYVVGAPLYRTAGSQFTGAELREQVERHDLTGRVGFVPFQPEPARVYRALDVFVHASTRREPFGLTIAEALACGRAAVISKSSGAAEALRDGEDVLAIEPGDANTLAAALRRLLEDEALRDTLARAARHTAVRRFSRERYARDILAVYRSLVPARGHS